MAVSPDPTKLFIPDEEAIPSFLGEKYSMLAGAILGFVSACGIRYMGKRPIFSGIQTHILLTGGLGAIGKIGQDRMNEYYVERDAVFRHYISLHPDDFPMPERVKIGDVFNAWSPVR